MNKDQVNGTIDELVGSAKRKTGGLTDNVQLQAEGMAQQVRGKVENAWGSTKNAVEEANKETAVQHDPHV
jgi:uncharacterized protein YjbJ (UPF0337 family)